jgi:hypothetical protein
MHIVTQTPVARQRPRNKRDNGHCKAATREAMEVMLQAAFSAGPLRSYMTRPTEFSSVKISGRKSQGAWYQDELTGGKSPVVK